MTRTTLAETCFTEVITLLRGSKRSGLNTGGVADNRSDGPGDMGKVMEMAETSIAAENAGEDMLEPIERHMNAQRRRRSEGWAAACSLGDWSSRMERVSAASRRTTTVTPNRYKDGHHAGDAHYTAGGAVARDGIVVGGKREHSGLVPPGRHHVGRWHQRYGCESVGCYRTGPERGAETGHRDCQPRGLDTRSPNPDRQTREAGGAPTAAAWKAA